METRRRRFLSGRCQRPRRRGSEGGRGVLTPRENSQSHGAACDYSPVEWRQLTLHDATQYISGVKQTVAKALGIPEENVRVFCPFTGGGFGCKGSTWSHVVLAAMAAKFVHRPVKLVLERPQMFGPVGNRPQTHQHIVLAAKRDGTLDRDAARRLHRHF